MCLVVFSFDPESNKPLTLLGNRDEFFDRPTRPIEFWNENKSLIAGRDLEAGGTWLGVNDQGKIGVITNYRHPDHFRKGVRSRGEIIPDFFNSNDTPEDFLKKLDTFSNEYVGFNIVLGTIKELYYYSNVQEEIVKIPKGIHGLSNAFLNTSWPKLDKAKHEFEKILKNETRVKSDFFELMKDKEKAPDDTLPNTGIGIEKERLLSSPFIRFDNYGTRCTSHIELGCINGLSFTERTFQFDETKFSDRNYQLPFSSDLSTDTLSSR